MILLLAGLGTDELEPGPAPGLERVEVRLLLDRRVLLADAGAQQIRARRTVGSLRCAAAARLRLVRRRSSANTISRSVSRTDRLCKFLACLKMYDVCNSHSTSGMVLF